MKPLGFPLLADENIHPDVVQALADQGKDIRSVQSEGLAGRRDVVILRHALPRGWVVLTHDSDFGTLAMRSGEPHFGIIYLRPGHIVARFVLEMLEAIESLPIELSSPFIVTAERKRGTVRVRVRSGNVGKSP
jgi:predicted nuclease of predicted toxin-antitoxin system